MLKVDIKSNRSTKWEMQVRAAIKTNALYAEDLDEFIRGFLHEISLYKRDSTGQLKDSYTADKKDGVVIVRHCNSVEERVIGIIGI